MLNFNRHFLTVCGIFRIEEQWLILNLFMVHPVYKIYSLEQNCQAVQTCYGRLFFSFKVFAPHAVVVIITLILIITKATRQRLPYIWRQICRNSLVIICNFDHIEVVGRGLQVIVSFATIPFDGKY